ncbi:MAG: helix-turn-helix domain-containing protein [Candidatus Kapabacteria bacterium]|jgi:AraC-like DNA-binding protein|nr:helix-turn-helix domain-containing protein [Candidatus Kapabacteria bacterium]
MMYIPTKPLHRFIEKFWIINDDALEYSAKIFPDGVVQMVVNLGSPYSVLGTDGKINHFAKGSLSGERMNPCSVKQERACHALGIRFRPGGAYPFFGVPMNELTQNVIDIEALWGASEVERFRERLWAASSPAAQCLVAVNTLLEKAGQNLQMNNTVEIALKYVLGMEEPSIRNIATTIGISHKHLLRQFDKFVGINPKALARIQRFQRSLKLLKYRADTEFVAPSQRLSLTEIAYESAYYDQSHFVHDFESFTGMNPTDYLQSISSKNTLPRFAENEYCPIRYYLHNLVGVSA